MKRGYRNVQHSPLPLIIGLVFAGIVGFAGHSASAVPTIVFVLALLAPVALILLFSSFVVEEDGDALQLAFGPLPLIRKRVRYADLAAVRETRTDLLDGFGIHWVPGRGWTWNLIGFAAVEVTYRNGHTLRIGAGRDARGLAEHLRQRILGEPAAPGV